MTTAVSFIIVLGILITAHELGHFLVAKALGMGVERFSIGFPPKMIGFRRGETEYCLSWIPLGGYVKLKGEGPEDVIEDPHDPRLFISRPPLQRAGVILAGPVMNLVLAFLIMPLVFMVGMSVPTYLDDPPVVSYIEPQSPADAAGILRGERITAVDGAAVLTWEDLLEAVSTGAKGVHDISLTGPGGDRTVRLDTGVEEGPRLGVSPPMAPMVGSLTPGFPAQEAGLQEGDLILELGGISVTHWSEMARIIHASAGKTITLLVQRGTETTKVTVVPRLDEKTGRGLLGISPRTETTVRRYGFAQSVSRGVERNIELLRLTFGFIGDLLTLNSSIKNLGGPIMIAQVTGEAARAGLAEFMAFMAFLSLQLGILNLLPIPVLDGGHLVFLTAEGVMGRPMNLRTREVAQKVGFFLLLLLILVISYNDVIRLLTGK
ncbi:MAG: RIP metalloprotease RseP [bacterium]|nr:MAG: RIP metalloprotease RseP [bacterium]